MFAHAGWPLSKRDRIYLRSHRRGGVTEDSYLSVPLETRSRKVTCM